MLDKTLEKNTPPSMALIRQLVTENIIFPLGSELLRKRHPEKIASVLFYGPEGTGKTLMVRAIASETKSIVFDLSPAATMDVYCAGRTDADKLVASVMKCAEVYQPAVVYIDECEKVWAAKKKKKKGQKGGGGRGGKNDLSNPSRYKKTLGKWKAKWITEDTRITILGCSSEVHECSRAEVKKFFDKSIYFPYPDYTTSCRMWKVFIENLSGRPLKTDFPLNTLAHMSIGYSAGAIRKAAEFVLTKFRKSKLDQRPLKVSEFIGPLSTSAVMATPEQHEIFDGFIDMMTGDTKRRNDLTALANGEGGDGDDGKKGKKGGKAKKKK